MTLTSTLVLPRCAPEPRRHHLHNVELTRMALHPFSPHPLDCATPGAGLL